MRPVCAGGVGGVGTLGDEPADGEPIIVWRNFPLAAGGGGGGFDGTRGTGTGAGPDAKRVRLSARGAGESGAPGAAESFPPGPLEAGSLAMRGPKLGEDKKGDTPSLKEVAGVGATKCPPTPEGSYPGAPIRYGA